LHYKIIKKIKCSDNIDRTIETTKHDSELCCDLLLQKLEKKFNAKLHADNPTDTVNGSLSVYHKSNDHVISIEFYEKNKASNSGHGATLHKLANIPSEKQCIDCLTK